MRRDKGPADRGTLTVVGAVVAAILAGAAFLLDPNFDQDALSQRLEEARRAAEAAQDAAGGPGGGDRVVDNQIVEARSDGAAAPFDYYLLALSWSPSFCESRPDADQCGKGHRFVLHGLWPQHERGYPQDCYTEANRRVPGRLLDRYGDLSPSRGLLAHQWRKHGSCSGLDARGYFETTRRALAAVTIPPSLARASKSARIDPRAVETAFVNANPGLDRDEVTITCKSGDLAEVRICLDKSLTPRRCGPDAVRDCSQRQIDLPAPK